MLGRMPAGERLISPDSVAPALFCGAAGNEPAAAAQFANTLISALGPISLMKMPPAYSRTWVKAAMWNFIDVSRRPSAAVCVVTTVALLRRGRDLAQPGSRTPPGHDMFVSIPR